MMTRQFTLLSLCLFSTLVWSNGGNNLNDYWQYEDFLSIYPTQKTLVAELAETVSSEPIHLSSTHSSNLFQLRSYILANKCLIIGEEILKHLRSD